MFKREYTLQNGNTITVSVPKQRQMNQVYIKAGVQFDVDNKVIIKDITRFNFELVKASTGLSDDEIGDLYETEYREITKITNELLKPKKEANDFLPHCSTVEND